MGNRRAEAPRCARCRLLEGMCICAAIPRLGSAIHVVLVLHHLEAGKPTNTGRLACLALSNSEVRVRQPYDPGPTIDPTSLHGRQAFVLYPSDDAQPLTSALRSQPTTLFVPDGTWNHASRVVRREPTLAALPRVRLAATTLASPRQVRNASRGDGLSTIEAIAAALGELGEPDNEAQLRALYDLFARRVLASRGV